VSAIDLPLVEGVQLPLHASSSLLPASDGSLHLRVELPSSEINEVETATHFKKNVPLHLQLVHLPSGWCSGMSEGFVVRRKVR